MYVGQAIKTTKLPDKTLEIIVIDNLTEECICIELNSHDAKRYNIKFNDIEV